MTLRVNNEVYYHINTGEKLKIGDTLKIGESFNRFYYEIYDSEHLKDEKDANQYMSEMRRKGDLSFENCDIANLIYKTVNDAAMITRELMFEEVRMEYNSSLPSRLKCLYVCKTLDEVKNWINIFKRTNKNNIQVVKLRLSGDIFVGDASFILRQNVSLNKKKRQARMYWSGEKKDNINEYLFIGDAVVEDILNIDE